MDTKVVQFLVIRYPSLKNFIESCVAHNKIDQLYDFLHCIDLEDKFMYINQ